MAFAAPTRRQRDVRASRAAAGMKHSSGCGPSAPWHPLVSVIVPVRNDAIRLRNCLESIRQSHYPREAIQLVVSDNGSTDDSAETARSLGARVVSCPRGGVAAARNAGAREADGTVFLFVDADHVVDEDWIVHAVEVLRDNPGVAAVGAPCYCPPDATWVQRAYDANRTRPRRLESVGWLGAGTIAVRTSAFLAVGGFDETLEACEDVAFSKALRRQGFALFGDQRLVTVHHGDPATLRALFFGELWRGRNNVRVSLWPPVTLGEMNGLILTIVMFAGLSAALVSLIAVPRLGWGLVAATWAVFLLVPVPRAMRIIRRLSPRWLPKAYLLCLVYECARALALVSHAPHAVRQRASVQP
jgi:GT2 family glycosyltransferase